MVFIQPGRGWLVPKFRGGDRLRRGCGSERRVPRILGPR